MLQDPTKKYERRGRTINPQCCPRIYWLGGYAYTERKCYYNWLRLLWAWRSNINMWKPRSHSQFLVLPEHILTRRLRVYVTLVLRHLATYSVSLEKLALHFNSATLPYRVHLSKSLLNCVKTRRVSRTNLPTNETQLSPTAVSTKSCDTTVFAGIHIQLVGITGRLPGFV